MDASERAFDYDGCIYFIKREAANPIVKFCFTCHCAQEIMANGGNEVLDEMYGGKD